MPLAALPDFDVLNIFGAYFWSLVVFEYPSPSHASQCNFKFKLRKCAKIVKYVVYAHYGTNMQNMHPVLLTLLMIRVTAVVALATARAPLKFSTHDGPPARRRAL